MPNVLSEVSPLWMSQHFSSFSNVWSLIFTFKFQLYSIYSLLSLNEFCPALAQPNTHLGPCENHKCVSTLIPALLPSLHCPVAQSLDTSVSPNSDLWLLNLLVLLFSPWTHLPCPENSPRQNIGNTWGSFCISPLWSVTEPHCLIFNGSNSIVGSYM